MRAFHLRTAFLLATALVAAPLTVTPVSPAAAQISIGFNITVEPPVLPVYEPPPLPAPGYIWQPGYWAYGDDGYYWVPGTWIEPPQPGLLWTPGYWGFVNGIYAWNNGYWADHVGFYGGINYGFGYTGEGYYGGEWRGREFFYNRAVFNNFGNVHVTNVFNRTVIVNRTTINNVSYNGGPHGVQLRPTPQQVAFAHAQHIEPTQEQVAHREEAARNRALLASVNHGAPPIAATQRPREFSGPGLVAARGATMRPEQAAKLPPLNPHQPGQHPNEFTRPDQGGRPGESFRPGFTAQPRPETNRAGSEVTHPAEIRPRLDVSRPQNLVPRAEAPRPFTPRPEAPRPEAFQPMARPEAPRPMTRPEAPRPFSAPQPPAPHPSPAPREEKPHN